MITLSIEFLWNCPNVVNVTKDRGEQSLTRFGSQAFVFSASRMTCDEQAFSKEAKGMSRVHIIDAAIEIAHFLVSHLCW